MRLLGGVVWQRGVVVRLRRHRVQRQVELVRPAKVEARARQRVVSLLRVRVALREIRSVRCDLVRDDALRAYTH